VDTSASPIVEFMVVIGCLAMFFYRFIVGEPVEGRSYRSKALKTLLIYFLIYSSGGTTAFLTASLPYISAIVTFRLNASASIRAAPARRLSRSFALRS